MKKFLQNNYYILLSFGLALILFFIGIQVVPEKRLNANTSGFQNHQQEKEVDLAPFWKVWQILDEKYYKSTTTTEITEEDMLWGAISGMVDVLGDPNTIFLPPDDSEIFESDISGNFEGVGMEVGMRDGVLTVISPLKNTPAYKAGILSGDKIVEIEGETTSKLNIMEAVKKIRGKKGTPVEFTIVREGEESPLKIEVIRGVIEIPTLDTEILDNGIFVIKLYNFSSNSSDLFRKALIELVASGSDKVILDLRGNPGGFLEASIDMASRFLPMGKVIVREDFGDKREPRVYRSRGYNVFGQRDLVILVNGGSASASEILAGALQEHGIAKIVGTETFGKGSVQELVKITPETSLKVTVAEWLTPEGNSISNGGLSLDYEVEITEEDREVGKDTQMEKAVEILLGN